MDAEGCPAFGYVLLFNEDDVAEYRSGENPAFPAVSLLFTDHADGSISGDLLGWSALDHDIFQSFALGNFFMLMEQAAQVAINAYRQVGHVPDRLIALSMPEDDLIQFDVHFADLQLEKQRCRIATRTNYDGWSALSRFVGTKAVAYRDISCKHCIARKQFSTTLVLKTLQAALQLPS